MSVNTTSSCVTMVLVVLMVTMLTLLPAIQGLPSPGCGQPLPDTPPPGNHSRCYDQLTFAVLTKFTFDLLAWSDIFM